MASKQRKKNTPSIPKNFLTEAAAKRKLGLSRSDGDNPDGKPIEERASRLV
jgi:hypothetical protein